MDEMLNHRQASIFLFLEGFASVAIQFLILRQVTPFVGSSVIVVSIVISLFLAALAIGYRQGGLVTRDHTLKLSRNLFIAATILGVFGSYLFVAGFYHFLHHFEPLALLLIYLIVVMIPVVYLVAQTIPILVSAMEADTVGGKTGDALLFSTVGNVFGGILTTVVIMYFLGVSWALVLTVFILYGLAVAVSHDKKRSLLLFIPFFTVVLLVNIGFDRYYFIDRTPYADYRIHEDINARYFTANRSHSSKLDKKSAKGYLYIEHIKHIVNNYGKYMKDPNVLVLGAGGFSLTADGMLKMPVQYVDIDGQIAQTAEKHFLKKEVNGTFTVADARAFLRKETGRYSFIIVDAYNSKLSIPENLTTVEFYKAVSDKLKPNGLMISNMVMDPFLADTFSKRMDNTIRAAFLSCYSDVVQALPGKNNVLYVCTNYAKAMPSPSEVAYTDNENKATVDFFIDGAR